VKVLDLTAARQKAYRLLSLRPHSEKELAKKLRDKGFSETVIKEALEKLRDLKYLNDSSFAVQWARNQAVNKLWGNRKIIAGLREKGVQARLIDEAVAAARQELSEEEAVAVLIRKKSAGKKIAVLEFKEKQKIFQGLMGRGFPPGLILNKLGKTGEEEFNGEDG
jgi:regulatory protein